jgi:hypothetical protein
VEKLNTRALESLEAALAAAGGANVVPGNNWNTAVTQGPEANLSEGADLPASDLAACQMAGELLRMGVQYDFLLLNPQQLFALRVCYGEKLQSMLASVGITGYFSNPLITAGTAYVLKRGACGIIGFEQPLQTETWREAHRRLIGSSHFASLRGQ